MKAPYTRNPPRQPICSMSNAEAMGMTTPESEMPIVAIPSAVPRRASNQFATSLAVARPPMALEPKPMSVARIR